MLQWRRMSYYLETLAPAVLRAAGLDEFVHVPTIQHLSDGLHRNGTRYLAQLLRGEWSTTRCGVTSPRRPKSRESVITYGRCLTNFLRWSERRGIELEKIEYQRHLVEIYQAEVASGAWSRSGSALQNQTANAYTQAAINYLEWMAERGLRPPLNVIYYPTTVSYATRSGRSGFKTVYVRKGSLKEGGRKKNTYMPSQAAFDRWHKDFETYHGEVWTLVVDTCTGTAMRETELSCLRVDDIPDDEQRWLVANPSAALSEQDILVTIRYGSKSADEAFCPISGDKIGKPREIRVPVLLARRLNEYKRGPRLDALTKRVDSLNGLKAKERAKAEAVQLFLDPKTGKRITADEIYRVWTHPAVKPPAPHWTVHSGRLWWACQAILNHWMMAFARDPKALVGDMERMMSTIDAIVRIKVQPQLGHVDPRTTAIYYRWLCNHLESDAHVAYEESLESFAEAMPEDLL